MPSIITRGSLSAQGFGFGAKTGAAATYYMSMFGLSNYYYPTQNSVSVNSSNSINSFFAQPINTGSWQGAITSTNGSGTINWQKELYNTNNQGTLFNGIVSDSSGNIYVIGYDYPTLGVYDASLLLVKYNSSGTLQWQKYLGASGFNLTPIGFGLDSSGNIYAVANAGGYPTNNFAIFKWNNSGTLLWQFKSNGVDYSAFGDATVDSSGNTYLISYIDPTNSGQNSSYVIKINSSGSIVWQTQIFWGFNNFGMNVISLDSSGNIYIAGGSYASSVYYAHIAKLNSSGAYQSNSALSISPDQSFYQDMNIDNSGNIYLGGSTRDSSSTNNFIFIAKYNTSLSLQWQRKIYNSDNTFSAISSLTADSLGSFYTSSLYQPSGQFGAFLAKLPADGSKTGTYNVGGIFFTYAASSLSISTPSLSSSSSSLFSLSSSSYTASDASLTEATTSITPSVTTL